MSNDALNHLVWTNIILQQEKEPVLTSEKESNVSVGQRVSAHEAHKMWQDLSSIISSIANGELKLESKNFGSISLSKRCQYSRYCTHEARCRQKKGNQ